MNPWEILLNVLGWVLVGVVVIFAILFLATVIIFLATEAKKKRLRKKVEKDPRTFDWGRVIRTNDVIMVGPQEFRVTDVESDFDIDYDRYRFRVTMEGDRGSASKMILFDS